MKRCWFGLVLLILLLAGGLLTARHMEQVHDPMIADISRAAQQSLSGDWANAEHLLDRARERWTDHWGLSASLSDHEPMEKIHVLFCRLGIAAQCRDAARFADLSANLTAELEAMGDAHGFVWWNFF